MKKVGLVLAAAALLAPVAAQAEAPTAFRQCVACHKVEEGKHGVGPSLFGVFGKPAAGVEGFTRYSASMKEANLVWDEATLNAYLTNPKAVVPKGTMAFAGLKKPEDVLAVIEYLKTVK